MTDTRAARLTRCPKHNQHWPGRTHRVWQQLSNRFLIVLRAWDSHLLLALLANSMRLKTEI